MTDVPLFDPAEHEPLCSDSWNEQAAREFVARVVRDADDAFQPAQFWPLHPEDRYDEERSGLRGVYCGAAGTMWALHRLATDNGLALRNDYAQAIVQCEEAYRSDPWETKGAVPSYFLGTTGIMAARYALTNDTNLYGAIEAEIRANVDNPTREALWGAPGSAIAALLVRERDGARCFDDVLRAVQDALWKTWIPADAPLGLLWEQELSGRTCRYVG
ncbi:MAG TPA: hypothetical protein VJP85_08755, partial [Candidatus Baltobacteraceae bacterium]|nr:hypothetical protein [Candidatus Baltobacteraceae bacterium]